jgi:glycosyltransferase involved in cell wall biosynthesis
MKILTIGASPYLLVRNGKINADVIERLVSEGHQVSSAVWHHDEGYFMPSDEGVHTYEKNSKPICQLYPFTPRTDEASPFVYELMKQVQPDLVITIGDHKDTNFVYAIKAMYPTLFKWIAIYTFDSKGLHPSSKDAFEYADASVFLSEFGVAEVLGLANIKYYYQSYGSNLEVFKEVEGFKREYVLWSARNAQASNLPAFIMGTVDIGLKPYIHTNLYDPGDYSIDWLKERYGAKDLEYTRDYCSIKEGIPASKLNEIYNRSLIMVDCSIKSATALSLLEGMACGCVPVGTSYGRVGEIIAKMPEGLRFTVPHNTFVGQNEEEYAIISHTALKSVLVGLIKDKDRLAEASKEAKILSRHIGSKDFLDKLVNVIIRDVVSSRQSVALDIV